MKLKLGLPRGDTFCHLEVLGVTGSAGLVFDIQHHLLLQVRHGRAAGMARYPQEMAFRRHAAGGEPYATPCEGPSWGNVAGLSLPLPLGEGTCLLGRNAPGLWPSGSLKTIHAK